MALIDIFRRRKDEREERKREKLMVSSAPMSPRIPTEARQSRASLSIAQSTPNPQTGVGVSLPVTQSNVQPINFTPAQPQAQQPRRRGINLPAGLTRALTGAGTALNPVLGGAANLLNRENRQRTGQALRSVGQFLGNQATNIERQRQELEDRLRAEGRDRAANNADLILGARAGLTITGIRPFVQLASGFGANIVAPGRASQDEGIDVGRNLFSDLFLENNQGRFVTPQQRMAMQSRRPLTRVATGEISPIQGSVSLLGLAGLTSLDAAPLVGGGGTRKQAIRLGQNLVERWGDDAIRAINAIRRGGQREIDLLPTALRNDVLQTLERVGVGNTNDLIRGALQTVQPSAADDVLRSVRQGFTDGETTTDLLRERGLITSVRQADEVFDPRITDEVEGTYRQVTNRQTINDAVDYIGDNYDAARQAIISKPGALDRVEVAASKLIAEELQAAGRFDDAVDFIENISQRATEMGQAIQAFALYGRLTPAGALRFAQRNIDQANAASRRSLGTGAQRRLSEEAAEAITNQANRVQDSLKAGREGSREHIIEVAKLQNLIAQQTPPTLGERVSSIQTLAQLLNPKTAIRNIIGNTGFAGLENVSDVVGAGLDRVVGAATGVRSRGLPSLRTQTRGFSRGFREGVEDVRLGIDTSNRATKFDLPSRQIWTKFNPETGEFAATKVLGNLEKALNFQLRTFDRAAYTAAYDDTVRDLMQLMDKNGIEVTDGVVNAIKERANFEGLRRTFQDQNFVSQVLSDLKRLLNKPTGGNFGLGDFVIKYPKTPGAILKRGIEYSPLAVFDLAFDLASPLIPYFKNNINARVLGQAEYADEVGEAFMKVMRQRYLVEKGARALTGTVALAGGGALMHQLGIFTGIQRDSDRDVAALDDQSGLGSYRINTSALKRWVMSGFNADEAKPQEGDVTMNYDWFQPAAIPVAIGVNINEQKGGEDSVAGLMVKMLTDPRELKDIAGIALDTLSEEPMFRGINTIMNAAAYAPADQGKATSIINALVKDMPASFIPTFSNQLAQIIDNNVSRATRSDDFVTETLQKVQARIPGLRSALPANFTTFGEEKRFGQDSLLSAERAPSGLEKIFNTFFNPAFVDRVDLAPEAQQVYDIMEQTGEKGAAPRVVSTSQTVAGGDRFKLTTEQASEMQRVIGLSTQRIYSLASQDPQFNALSAEDRNKILSGELSDIYNTAKYTPYAEYLGVDIPEGVYSSVIKAAVEEVSRDPRWENLSREKKGQTLQIMLNNYAASQQ